MRSPITAGVRLAHGKWPAIDRWLQRWELLLVGLLGTLLLGAMAAWLGVWEPWEAQRAAAVEAMLRRGEWLRVPALQGEASIAALPYGWWPARASVGLLGLNELGLRLPGLLLGGGLIFAMFGAARALYGRGAAWFASVALLSLPLFVFHSRHLLRGPEAALVGLASLAMLYVGSTRAPAAKWRWAAWIATAVATLCAGGVGLLVPLVAGLTAALGRPRGWRQLFDPLPVLAALVIIGVGAAAALLARPPGMGRLTMLLWPEPLAALEARKGLPTFDQFLHQVGFGLYPIGALVPFALARMVWPPAEPVALPAGAPLFVAAPLDGAVDAAQPLEAAPDAAPPLDGAAPVIPAADSPTTDALVLIDEGATADPAVAAWFAAAFLAPALMAAWGPGLPFLGAPAVALAAGVYLSRVVREPPQPLLGLATALVLGILHVHLTRDTKHLADTLVGGRVEGFPPALQYWTVAKLLGYSVIAVVVLWQGGLVRALGAVTRFVVYPRRPLSMGLWMLPVALVLTGVIYLQRLELVQWLQQVMRLRGLEPSLQRFLATAAIFMMLYAVLYGVGRVRLALTLGRQDGRLGQLADRVAAVLQVRWVMPALFGALLGGWALFHNVLLDRALSTNFSQRDLIERYEQLADEGEPLVKYGVDRNEVSFYTRRLPEMTPAELKQKGDLPERFFAIVPRTRLAAVNSEFRTQTGRNLPVVDDESFRFLLVSNQLEAGETDANPISRAIVSELPAGVKSRVSVKFEDTLEIVGWQLEPEIPRAGSQLKIIVFWKVLKKTPHTWKVFIHIDGGGSRIHGDHDPVAGLYPTTHWAPGDIVRDEHRMLVNATTSDGTYTFYAGLFRGDTRMTISAGPKDNENRANLGQVKVR